ncbi:MAG: enoyl-[acyl-carrier-protein] reductase FabL [Candidatus Promineifilaceae bacterium]|nr:enoyl-[acyl-carrier-protein] reductase FabL [Candidatus Promineifilaceae bacterium]
MKRFSNKVALVTGSGRGIGREIAVKLAGEGAHVVVNFFRNREPAEETAAQIRELGRQALVVKANVGDLDDLDSMFGQVGESFGRLDILVHNAASGYNRPVLEQRPRGWEWTMNINARSLLFEAQHAAQLMQPDGGAIVAVTSLGSTRVMPDYVVVGASKAALEALVRYIGVELAPLNIRVNAVSPGLVVTDALEHFSMFDEEGRALIEETRQRTPVGRLCEPQDVAELVAYLCDPRASMICGQTIIIDGGYSLLAKT